MQARSIERRASVLGGAAILATAVLAGGCAQILGIEELSAPVDAGPSDFAVRGTAAGVLGPVALELRIGGDSELLSVTRDGTFAFETRLKDGASYAVVLVDQRTPCMLRNQTDVIAGADTAIELTCTVPSLSSVVVSGVAPTVMLVPGRTDYVIDLPLSQPAVTLTASVATTGDKLVIAGTPVDSGTPSAQWIAVRSTCSGARARPGRRPTSRRPTAAPATTSASAWRFWVKLSRSGPMARTVRRRAWAAARLTTRPRTSGAVYVFRRTGTTWQQEAYLKASNTDALDSFGASVALSSDTLAVGAYGEDSSAQGLGGNQADNGARDSGAAYVFRRTGTTWQQEAYLKASNTDATDLFGASVALSDDTLAVGAHQEDSAVTGVNGNQAGNGAADSGVVYVFRRRGMAWQQEAYLKASNSGASDNFGHSVALSGDTLAVGALHEDSAAQGVDGNQNDNGNTDSGAVYIFH